MSAQPSTNENVTVQTGLSRRVYNEWINGAVALARALRYPVDSSMVNDTTGIVFGADQYAAFDLGLWSPEPYEMMIILESMNEAAVDNLPLGASGFAEYGGLCDKLMILHPGKYCPPHYHPRKTESYEVILGEMDLFYNPRPIPSEEPLLKFKPMDLGSPWPPDVTLPAGREGSYQQLTAYRRIGAGSPKFVMNRKHLHAFRCPPDADLPVVIREVSTYSHEPTEIGSAKPVPFEDWRGLHDNVFVTPEANEARLRTVILDEAP